MERPSTDAEPTPEGSLAEAARVVAHGGELEAKLDALARQVLNAAGASAAVIYIFDPQTRLLDPAAQAGLDAASLAEQGAVPLDDPDELVARAVRERQAIMGAADGARVRALESQGHAPASVAALPIVAADEAGAEDVEGALVAAFDDERPARDAQTELSALADLCAVAIRQARLENALLERADWLARLATVDPLTGLANRITFERMVELEVARAIRQESKLSLVFFDVDAFGEINRQAGAEAADDVLRHVASTLSEQVRVIDTIARLGPDEFGLIAPGWGGAVVGQRIQAAAATVIGESRVTLSAGWAVYPDDAASAQELLAAAGRALDAARQRESAISE
jgi:diguanylate cyclase (GGDEF)-like protein